MKNIIIDTDMGNDDLIAISLLLNKPAINIKAISTVRGVADLDRGTNNLARLLTFVGRTDLPIYQGFSPAKQKIDFPKIDRRRANNLTLLKNISLPKLPSKKVIIKKFNYKLDSPVSLLCLGPLTNIAKAIQGKSNINEIVIMGGAVFKPGNIPPDFLCEYNIALDPVAAKTVFSSNLPITLVATDTAKQAPAANKQFLKQVLSTKPRTRKGKIIKSIIVNNRRDFIDFYDPLAAAILAKSSIITGTKKIKLSVTRNGQTNGQLNNKGNINLVTKINRLAFYRFLVSSI